MQLNEYKTLGRSGLRVSPLCLGTMTFGTEWGWGSEENVSRSIFDRYIEAGGNFIDTADAYTGGKSEEQVGKFIAGQKLRDRVVLATKFTFNAEAGNPNAGGNGRKNIYRALHGSLRRLQTDYIDLYWLHAWDKVTPIEEVISTLNDLVREGKIRHAAQVGNVCRDVIGQLRETQRLRRRRDSLRPEARHERLDDRRQLANQPLADVAQAAPPNGLAISSETG